MPDSMQANPVTSARRRESGWDIDATVVAAAPQPAGGWWAPFLQEVPDIPSLPRWHPRCTGATPWTGSWRWIPRGTSSCP